MIRDCRVIIRSVLSEAELTEMYYVRWLVLRKPLEMAQGTEQDNHEKDSFHLLAIVNERIVGSARLREVFGELGLISYVAVLPEFRNQRIGSRLIKKLINKAQTNKLKFLKLNARTPVLKFYKRLGFQETSQVFEYLGIPHITMEMKL
ncbi:GNAT family N-acetyltransferase [Nostoc sp. PA-18-2419]|uniref:GNAT family N-acetyltransferase n=1 Tax=Nostoc sp. PA-18-2419 TaxID=2575443 RepID=UPI0011081835|nr:GNAT family N-acetyltransferase [Nostoc sp. PA-18-2419]